jgi:hypothetical protein
MADGMTLISLQAFVSVVHRGSVVAASSAFTHLHLGRVFVGDLKLAICTMEDPRDFRCGVLTIQ